MATAARKLENDDIRAIFESLHDNKPPPPGLDFQIVPVDSDGLRLSPPAHEYEGKVIYDDLWCTSFPSPDFNASFLFFRWNLRFAKTG